MKKKNYFLALVIALVMALSVSMFALAGCGGGDPHPADTSIEGAISAQSYASADAAASAFLTEELNGNSTSVSFVSYTKEADLTEDEIAKLNLGDIDVESVTSVESGRVTFTENTRAAGEKTARVYIVKVGNVYFYYVPIFERGEIITKSYISDILDYRKYTNVTETSVTSSSASGITSKITITTKITEKAIYQKMEQAAMGMTIATLETYIIDSNGTLFLFVKTSSPEYPDASWQSGSTTEYTDIPTFIEDMFKFDHTYFVKTNSGFELSADKLSSYLEDVMSGLEIMGTITDASAKYYVKDGKLDETSVNISMQMTVEANNTTMTVKVKATGSTTYTNYGTTTVDIPPEITAMMYI